MKRNVIFLITLILLLGAFTACGRDAGQNGADTTAQTGGAASDAQTQALSVPDEDGVTVLRANADAAEWETYSDFSVEIQIPKGWTVTCSTPSDDMFCLRYEVTSPEETGCRIVYYVTDPNGWYNDENYVQTSIERMRDSEYPDMRSAAEHIRFLPELSAKGYFTGLAAWDGGTFEALAETKLEETSYFEDTDFYHQYDVAVLSGRRTAADGRVYEGRYRASVYGNKDASPMINPLTGEAWSYPSFTVSSVRVLEAPADTFNSMLPVLQRSLDSLTFTEAYCSLLRTAVSAKSAALGDMAGDPVATAKLSDATFGYERVYDTETGDVYMADYGFIEKYERMDGQRYAAVTDDMYTNETRGFLVLD